MEIEALQQAIRAYSENKQRIALKTAGNSNTTRSKSYNKGGVFLDLRRLNRILKVDPEKKTIHVESRVTMEELVKATLPFGLMPPVVPEFKGITVGGAIMGCAAESGSHRWGLFSDTCTAFEVILGDGSLVALSPTQTPELFYAVPGSYGTLGLLVSATIQLITVLPTVHISYKKGLPHPTNTPFSDGIVFDKEHTVHITANFSTEKARPKKWYFEEARKEGETCIPLFDYLFRYDRGAFWMGAYLFKFPFLCRFITQGLLKFPAHSYFREHEIKKMLPLPIPPSFLLDQMPSQRLFKLHHKAEPWINSHLMIQDCCIPSSRAEAFIKEVTGDLGLFPLWLCPIKNSPLPQLFAPHSLQEPILNIGLYGLPARSAPLDVLTKEIERKTRVYGGRKVLYSRSYYTPEEFWEIYDEPHYRKLRYAAYAEGVWPDITEKVLSG